MLERGAQSNWAKMSGDLKMPKNLGTIAASAYLLMLEVHGAKAQTCGAESIPKTGKPFDNIRYGQNKQPMNS